MEKRLPAESKLYSYLWKSFLVNPIFGRSSTWNTRYERNFIIRISNRRPLLKFVIFEISVWSSSLRIFKNAYKMRSFGLKILKIVDWWYFQNFFQFRVEIKLLVFIYLYLFFGVVQLVAWYLSVRRVT